MLHLEFCVVVSLRPESNLTALFTKEFFTTIVPVRHIILWAVMSGFRGKKQSHDVRPRSLSQDHLKIFWNLGLSLGGEVVVSVPEGLIPVYTSCECECECECEANVDVTNSQLNCALLTCEYRCERRVVTSNSRQIRFAFAFAGSVNRALLV